MARVPIAEGVFTWPSDEPQLIGGRCGACGYLDVCGGNTRVRAHQLTGNFWAEDPACYLSDAEIDLGTPRELEGAAIGGGA